MADLKEIASIYVDRTLSVKKPDLSQNAVLICGYHHCHRKLRKPLYDQRFPVSFLQAEDTTTMTKDYEPKNTDFVWNGDESRHSAAPKKP